MKSLRASVIRLAHDRPEFRKELLSVLKKAASGRIPDPDEYFIKQVAPLITVRKIDDKIHYFKYSVGGKPWKVDDHYGILSFGMFSKERVPLKVEIKGTSKRPDHGSVKVEPLDQPDVPWQSVAPVPLTGDPVKDSQQLIATLAGIAEKGN